MATESNIQRFSTITLQVRDLDRAVWFYRDGLGLNIEHYSDSAAQANVAGVTLLLHRDIDPNLPELRGAGIELHFAIPDADSYLAELRDRGIDVHEEPEERPWGRTFHLKDPDGYDLEFVAPPTRSRGSAASSSPEASEI